MAITFIGATSNGVISATGVSVTPHASTQANDVMVAFVGASDSAAPTTAPSGWAQLQSVAFSSSTRALKTFWKLAQAGDLGAAQTWSHTAAVNWAASIIVFRDIDVANPINNSNIVANATSTTWSIQSGLAINNMKPYVVAICGFYGSTGVAPTVNSPLTAASGSSSAATSIAGAVGYEQITSAIGARNATGSNVASAASVVYIQDTSTLTGEIFQPTASLVEVTRGSRIIEIFKSRGPAQTLALIYRMRAFDSTLGRTVYWSTETVDGLGSQYTGPGPLSNIVVSEVICDD